LCTYGMGGDHVSLGGGVWVVAFAMTLREIASVAALRAKNAGFAVTVLKVKGKY
jgi:hypothetical protein